MAPEMTPRPHPRLTTAEQDVALTIARGLSNEAITRVRGTSTHASAACGAVRLAALACAAGALLFAAPIHAQPVATDAQPAQSPPPAPAARPGPASASPPPGAPEQAAPATAQPAGTGYGLVVPPPVTPRPRLALPRSAVILRGSLLTTGSGTLKDSCSSGCTSDSLSYTHNVAIALSADFLWKLASVVRLGPELMYVVGESVSMSGTGLPTNVSGNNIVGTLSPSFGSDLALDAVLEIAPQVARTVWAAPRVQLGGGVIFPGGDLGHYLDLLKSACKADGYGGCDAIGSPAVGWNAGLGFGVIFAVSKSVRLRGDLLAQYYSFSLFTVHGGVDSSESISSSRYFLAFGVEF